MLIDQIDKDIKTSMLSKDSNRLRTIRGLKSALVLKKTEKNNTDLSDEDFLLVVQKCIKTRKESIDIFATQNRNDLVEQESIEISILQTYLPQQLSIQDITVIIQNIVTDVDAKNIKDMGKVMAIAKVELAGKADNKTISDVIKSFLN